jgi:arsenite methyltransferase
VKNGCASCCDTAETSRFDYTVFATDYTKLVAYNPDADPKLGCGIRTEHARIKAGDTVVDLPWDAGNNGFVARALVGETGSVIRIDMTQPMIEKARQNVEALGYENVEFHLGEIEAIPLGGQRRGRGHK